MRLRNYLKGRAKELGLDDVRVNTSGCLDRCELGPSVVIYPDAVWYTVKNEADMDEILERHLLLQEVVERLQMPPGRSAPDPEGPKDL